MNVEAARPGMTQVVCRALVVSVALIACSAVDAAAQDQTVGPGKIEIGLFPMGGTFLIGGDDDREVNFNEYTSGGTFTYYLSARAALEGELGVSLGLAQDVVFRRAKVFHVQMPNVWSYFGNVVFFPQGTAGKLVPFYLTGGIGLISLQAREPTKPLGYDVDVNGWQTFVAENVGGGVKIFRASSPNWGFRADYRYLIVNANDSAPAFFAKAKSRGGHRIYFGVLYTWKD